MCLSWLPDVVEARKEGKGHTANSRVKYQSICSSKVRLDLGSKAWTIVLKISLILLSAKICRHM